MKLVKVILATMPALFLASKSMAFTVVNTTDSDLKINITAKKQHTLNPAIPLSQIKLSKNSTQTNLGGFSFEDLKTQASGKGGTEDLYDISLSGAEVGSDTYVTCPIKDSDTTITFTISKNVLACESSK
jgi:hypothetical protein